MKTVNLAEILVYYDGIQVFAARDAAGADYVGVGYGPQISPDRYMVTPAAPEPFQQFRVGQLDLRTLLLAAPGGQWYIGVAKEGDDCPFILEPQPIPVSASPCLPGPNFVLTPEPIESLAEWQAQKPAGLPR